MSQSLATSDTFTFSKHRCLHVELQLFCAPEITFCIRSRLFPLIA